MVPLVDLEAEDPGPALADGLRAVGFVELVGHGIDAGCFDRLRDEADRFFDLPVDTKQRYVHADPLGNRGYRGRGTEALAYSLGADSPPDLFESFNAGGGNPAEPSEPASDLRPPTPWPDAEVPGFRTAVGDVVDALAPLGRRLDTLIGRAIGIEDLADRSTTGPDMLACIDYRPAPDGTEVVVEGQQRMGAHSDYTTFTLLRADPVPGLQIVAPSGGWIDVVPRPDSLLLNVGDLLAMWTNDVWPSTLHRVVPMQAGGAARRRSIAWFHYPDPDVAVRPLESFCSERPARYEPVTVEAHVRGKLGAPKTLERPTSASTAGDRRI